MAVLTSTQVTGSLFVSNSLSSGTTFTASLQTGYVWVGGANNVSVLIPTSSFKNEPYTGSLNVSGSIVLTGSLLVTGSTVLVGTKTITGSVNISGSKTIIGNNIVTGSLLQTAGNNILSNTLISGSSGVTITGSLFMTGSQTIIGNSTITGSLLMTGSTTLVGNQTITGSLIVTQNLTILGSASVTTISSSVLNVGTNIITANTLTPTIRFGGLAIIDSGSSLRSGSWLFDSVNDNWIMVHQGTTAVTTSVALMGAETYNNIGSETYPTLNRVVKGLGYEHIGDSNISDTGTEISLNSLTSVTGSFRQTGGTNTITDTIVSGSTGLIVTGSILQTGRTVVTGSLIVSGSGGGGVFSKNIYVFSGSVATPLNYSSSFKVWRAPFSASVVAVYGMRQGNSTGATATQVNAFRSSSITGQLAHTGSNIILSAADIWFSATTIQNNTYGPGDTLVMHLSASNNTQIMCQVDFVRI